MIKTGKIFRELFTSIRRGLNHILSSKIVRNHRYSITGAFICMILIIILIMPLQNNFELEKKSINIHINNSGENVKFEVWHITIDQKDGRDRLEIHLAGHALADSGSGHIAIRTPSWLKFKRNEGWSGNTRFREQWKNEDKTWRIFDYSFTNSNFNGSTLIFVGNFLNSSARESQLDFSLNCDDAAEFGTRVTITNLNGMDLIKSNPIPSFQSEYAVDYSKLQYSRYGGFNLIVHFYNRLEVYKIELHLFLIAVIIGVLSSIIGNVLFLIIRSLEVSKTQSSCETQYEQ